MTRATIAGGALEPPLTGHLPGRLRWGGEEAFWGNYFNGAKKENPWADVAQVELDRPPAMYPLLGRR